MAEALLGIGLVRFLSESPAPGKDSAFFLIFSESLIINLIIPIFKNLCKNI